MAKDVIEQLLHAGLNCDFRVSIAYLRILEQVEREEKSQDLSQGLRSDGKEELGKYVRREWSESLERQGATAHPPR